MNKQDFYKFLKQQYKDYKIEYETLSASCEGCPCKTLRKKVFGTHEQPVCTDEMMYLINKYRINGANPYLCEGSMLAALKIAKKMSENFNRI